jgi:AcrR family transcriptional regulator
MSAAPPGGATVEAIARAAQRGRNTFYAHFASVEQAFRAVEAAAIRAVAARAEGALAAAVTPRQKLRGLAEAWLDAAEEEPEMVLALLASNGPRRAELAREQLARALADAREAGAISQPLDEPRVVAATGVLEALVRLYAERRLERDAAATLLVDVVLRVFR